MPKVRLLFLSGMLSALVFAGCGGDEAESPAPAEDTVVTEPAKDGEGFSMSFTGKDGKSGQIQIGGDNGFSMNIDGGPEGMQMKIGQDAAIPEDFPKDVPVYKNTSLNLTQSTGDGFVIQGTVKDDVDTVSAFFKAQAGTLGWEEENTVTTTGDGAMTLLSYTKGERSLTITVTRQGNETMIQIVTNQ